LYFHPLLIINSSFRNDKLIINKGWKYNY